MQNVKENNTREMTLTRMVNAPRELVWQAWTDPKHVAAWWGPRGFTNPLCQWDAKPGNTILVHMQGPDGTVFPMDGNFIELVKPERMVFIAAALDKNGKRLFENRNTITFTEEGNKTKLSMHVIVSKIMEEGAPYLDGMNAGWNQSIDKLDEYLQAKAGTNNSPVVVERIFNASASNVWKAITNKDDMKKWYFDLAEFKPEVGFEFRFEGGDKTKKQSFLHICVITEVEAGKKITYSWRYDGYEGISHVTFELFPEGDKTRLRLTHIGLESFKEEAFARQNFAAGWTAIIGTQLKDYLEKKIN